MCPEVKILDRARQLGTRWRGPWIKILVGSSHHQRPDHDRQPPPRLYGSGLIVDRYPPPDPAILFHGQEPRLLGVACDVDVATPAVRRAHAAPASRMIHSGILATWGREIESDLTHRFLQL